MISRILKEDIKHTLNLLTPKEAKKLKDASILITGCAGFLGYYFLHFFYECANELGIKRVIGIDNFMLGYPGWIDDISKDKRFSFSKFDIITDSVESISGWEDVDYVIHMASIASPTFYRQFPIETIDANVWGLRSLLDTYKYRDIKGFLFFSSSEYYGDPDPDQVPTRETYNGNVSAVGPRACYDEAKRFGETLCMLYSQKFEMPIGVVRPFNNYGPGMKLTDKRVPADFSMNAREGRDIVILSNGTPTRTFCYISDSVAGFLKVMLYGKYDYFNIGTDRPEITIAELAEIYKKAAHEIFGNEIEIVYEISKEKEYLTNNPQRRCPDIAKARELLGYHPNILVNEGVRRFLEFIATSNEEHLVW